MAQVATAVQEKFPIGSIWKAFIMHEKTFFQNAGCGWRRFRIVSLGHKWFRLEYVANGKQFRVKRKDFEAIRPELVKSPEDNKLQPDLTVEDLV